MHEVLTPEGLLAGEISGGLGPASGVVADPWRIRRELTSPGGSVLETVLAPERLPGLVVQWNGAGIGAVRPSLALPGVSVSDVDRGREGLLEVPGPGGGVRLFRLAPEGVLRPRPEGDGVRLEGTLPGAGGDDAPERVTLVVAWGGSAGHARSRLATLCRTAVLEGWARGAAEGGRGLRLSSGVPEMDTAAVWARARLRSRPAFVDPGGSAIPLRPRVLDPTLERCLAALALLVLGDGAGADALAGELDPATTPGVLARSWLTAWQGTTGAVEAAREALLEWASGTDEEDDALRPAARVALADALEVAGRDEDAETVRSGDLAGTGPARGSAAGGSRRLPMVDAATDRPRTVAQAVAAALAGDGVAARWVGDRRVDAGNAASDLLAAWGLGAAGRGEESYARLRSATRPGQEPDASPYLADAAATLFPLALVLGLLGARADAGYGRLRLAPALPRSWTRFRVDGIALGTARLDLIYRSGGGTRTFTLRPSGGPIPATVVFEPVVAGRVRGVEVDGRPVPLDAETSGDGTRIRLQLPVDAERTLRIHGQD